MRPMGLMGLMGPMGSMVNSKILDTRVAEHFREIRDMF